MKTVSKPTSIMLGSCQTFISQHKHARTVSTDVTLQLVTNVVLLLSAPGYCAPNLHAICILQCDEPVL